MPVVPSPVVPTVSDIGEAVADTSVIVINPDVDADPVRRHRGGAEPEQKHSNQSGA
jgi:hypothetical protein